MSSIFKLTVSKACLQEWSSMQPKPNGRYCTACETTVIDFSKMSNEEVANFFLLNNREPVCGRFKAAQLERIEIVVPTYFFKKHIPLWKKYLLLLLVCFATDILPGAISSLKQIMACMLKQWTQLKRRNQNTGEWGRKQSWKILLLPCLKWWFWVLHKLLEKKNSH